MAQEKPQGAGRGGESVPAAWCAAAWDRVSDPLIILDEMLRILHSNAAARGLLFVGAGAGPGDRPWGPAVAAGFDRLCSGEPIPLAGLPTAAEGLALPPGPHGERAVLVRFRSVRAGAGVATPSGRSLLALYRLALGAPGSELPWAAFLREAARVTPAAAVLWVTRKGGLVRVERGHGLLPAPPADWPATVTGELFGPTLAAGRARSLAALDQTQPAQRFLAAAGLRSLLVVPVRVAGHLAGAVAFGGRRRGAFDAAVRGNARLVAETLGMMLENERLCHYLENCGGRTERERLAAELHDGVVQDLYGVQLELEDLADRVDGHPQPDGLPAAVGRIRNLVDGVLAELRQTIADLNQSGDLGQGLVPALRGVLLHLRRETGITTRLELAAPHDTLDLTRMAKLQVLRILQEALTNVKKHSGATRVTARIEEFPGYYRFSVQDDGVGFDPAGVGEGHFGLQIMKERAASVDGIVAVDSEPGRGTRLVLSLPRPPS